MTENEATKMLEAEFQMWIEEVYGNLEEMNAEQLDEQRMAYFAGAATLVGFLVKTFVTERQLMSKRQFGNMLGEIDLYIHDMLRETGGMQ